MNESGGAVSVLSEVRHLVAYVWVAGLGGQESTLTAIRGETSGKFASTAKREASTLWPANARRSAGRSFSVSCACPSATKVPEVATSELELGNAARRVICRQTA